MNPPKVTVITPTKNRLKLLCEAMDSVQQQSVCDWEHIIVEDGSDDGTAEEVARRAATDPRIRLICRTGEKAGANVCRNIGIRESQAELIVFLDSDDLLRPQCLDQRIEIMQKNLDLDFATFKAEPFESVPGDLNTKIDTEMLGDDLLRFLFFEYPWIITGPVWRKTSLLRLGLFDESLISWQDIELHIRALSRGLRYLRFAEVDHLIRWHSEPAKTSIEQRRSARHLEAASGVLEKFELMIREGPGMNWVRQRALCSPYFFVAEQWIAAGSLSAALSSWTAVRRRRLASRFLHLSGAALLIIQACGGPCRTLGSRVGNKWKGLMRLRTNPELIPKAAAAVQADVAKVDAAVARPAPAPVAAPAPEDLEAANQRILTPQLHKGLSTRENIVDCVYVAASTHDARYTRICVASIRYFYPELPIRLLVGGRLQHGLADELQLYWNVGIADLAAEGEYGWGFVKLEPLFGPRGERFLILDSDTVLTGPILDVQAECKAPFLVDGEAQPDRRAKEIYYDWQSVRKVDPGARRPEFLFNTGQWFGTAGVLMRDDFAPWVEWTMPRRLHPPSLFMNGEQGILNYVLNQKAAKDGLRVERRQIMHWPGHSMHGLDAEAVSRRAAEPRVVHWAGMKRIRQRDMIGADLLAYFEKAYYQRLPSGEARRFLAGWRDALSQLLLGARVRVKLASRKLAAAR
jgi:GT2 family glycosyltransferase